MGLSDLYGGNIDLNKKYGNPHANEKLSTTAAIRPGYKVRGSYSLLPKEIEVCNALDQDHYDLLRDAYDYMDKSRFRSITEANDNEIATNGYAQVLAQDNDTVLLAPISSEIIDDDGYVTTYSPMSKEAFLREICAFYTLSENYQKYAIINFKSGTFIHDEYYVGDLDAATTKIVFFNDDSIYIQGASFGYNNIPVDYCSKVLEDAIETLNWGNYDTFIPEITARVYLERKDTSDRYGKKYIKKYTINEKTLY